MATMFTALLGNVTTTTQTATLLVASSADRKGLFLNATQNIMIGGAGVTNTSNGFRVLANTHIQLGNPNDFNGGGVPTGDIYFVGTATCTCYTMVLS